MSETAADKSQRTSTWAAIPLILCIAGMLVSPYLIASFVPENIAGWSVLGTFLVLSLGCGIWFGALSIPTWWFSLAIGVTFMVAQALYFQEGLFLYAVGFAVLAGLGTLITGVGKLDLDAEDDGQDAHNGGNDSGNDSGEKSESREEVERGEVGA